MDGIGPAQALGTDAGAEDGKIGWVEDAVADAGQEGQGNQRRIAADESDKADRQHHQGQTANQEPAGAIAVNQDACRILQKGGGEGINGDHRTQRRKADPNVLLDEQEQRRQG